MDDVRRAGGVRPRVFVGRARELAALRAAYDAAATGTPSVVLVVGEAGVGKTTLLAEAFGDLDELLLSASGDEAEAGLDFGVVEQILRGARRYRDDPPHRRDDPDPLRVGVELLRVFDELVLDVPLVVAVDDAHLADASSLQALAFAARRLRNDRAMIVLAGRPDLIGVVPPGLARLASRTGGTIELRGLDTAAVAALAGAEFGRPVPPAVAERVRVHTGGHPLHTRVLLEQLDLADLFRPGSLPAPRSFSSLVLGQLASCSEDAQRLLAALSVLDEPADLTTAARIGGVAGWPEALDELTAGGFVDVGREPGRVTAMFRHGLIRSSVYGDLPTGRRVRLHMAAAEALSGPERVRHRLAGATGPDPQLAAEVAAVARCEAATGARTAAAQHLLDAAAITPDPSAQEDLVLDAAELMLATGQPLAAQAADIEGFADSARRSYVLGRLVMSEGRFDDARPLLERAWAQAAGECDPSAIGGGIAEHLAVIALCTLRPDEVMCWARRALTAGGGASAATMVAHGLALAGDLRGAYRAVDDIAAAASGQLLADARLGRGIVAVWSNRLEQAERDLATLTSADDHPAFLHQVNARAYLAETYARTGRLAEAIAWAETTIALIDDAQLVYLEPLPRAVAAGAHAAAGDIAAAREHATIASRIADATGQAPAHIWTEHAWLRIADAEHEPGGVVAVGDRIVANGWDRLPEGVHHWRATYAEALLAVGRRDDAERVVTELESAASGTADVSLATEAARARGTLLLSDGQVDAADAAFASGLALDAGEARPLPRGRLELAAGARLRRAGRRTAAAELLRSAADRLSGARPWLEQCDRELAASGLRPARRSQPGATMALTAQETVVASLVAAGRTNREVASELTISVKTVEHHLSRVYTKLGVRSRSHLAATMRPTAPGDAPTVNALPRLALEEDQ